LILLKPPRWRARYAIARRVFRNKAAAARDGNAGDGPIWCRALAGDPARLRQIEAMSNKPGLAG
jgi:hypothetical protein